MVQYSPFIYAENIVMVRGYPFICRENILIVKYSPSICRENILAKKDLAGREKLCIFAKILTTMKRPRQDRWYGDLKRRRPRPEKRLLCEPQFGLEELYRMPFAERREFDTQSGAARYFPIEREPQRSGVRMLDELLAWLDAGSPGTVAQFCEKRGLSYNDLGGLVFCLTGMSGEDFRLTYQMRMADDLMRYTRMTLAEVARRSGIGSPLNLNQSYRREYDLTPGERRRQLRQKGDAGRYRL